MREGIEGRSGDEKDGLKRDEGKEVESGGGRKKRRVCE